MSKLTYYKATRPDGTDFRTGAVGYATALISGETLTHPCTSRKDDASTYYSVSVEPAETLIGGSWPCRLFRVEPVGRTLTSSQHPHKRAAHALRVVEELPAHLALGPNGVQVAAVIERAGRLTHTEARRLGAARGAARGAAWGAAWDAAWGAARDAARDAARGAAWCAAWGAARDAAWDAVAAYVVRDLITEDQFGTLAGPWLSVIGEVA